MKNKVFKYIKVFISVALILSLVAPSYASLSASDGSAFVTKAEFDSALADFNSRLTTFEAGINSKIDSQVTTYLDRNGIWNGRKFELSSDINSAGTVFVDLCNDVLKNNKVQFNNKNTWYRPIYSGGVMTTESFTPAATQDRWAYLVKQNPDYKILRLSDNCLKSGLLTGYIGYRMWANHMHLWNEKGSNPTVQEMVDIQWLPQFRWLPEEQQTYDALMSITTKAGDPVGETNIMVSRTPLNDYQAGFVFCDFEIKEDDADGALKYRANAFRWGIPQPGATGKNNAPNSVGWCQWSAGDYDSAPHTNWLNFFVAKGHSYVFCVKLYCAGRSWDNNVGFADGGMANAPRWIAVSFKDLLIY